MYIHTHIFTYQTSQNTHTQSFSLPLVHTHTQVHRATTLSGMEVAVKIQYPGVSRSKRIPTKIKQQN